MKISTGWINNEDDDNCGDDGDCDEDRGDGCEWSNVDNDDKYEDLSSKEGLEVGKMMTVVAVVVAVGSFSVVMGAFVVVVGGFVVDIVIVVSAFVVDSDAVVVVVVFIDNRFLLFFCFINKDGEKSEKLKKQIDEIKSKFKFKFEN